MASSSPQTRRDEPGPRWGPAVGAALALHLAVIGGALLVARPRPPAPNVSAAFRVEMLPAPPTDMPVGPVQDEAAPKPIERPKVKLPFTPPEINAPVPTALTLPKPADSSVPAPLRPVAAAAPATTRPPASQPAPVAAPAGPSAATVAAADNGWLSRLLAQLERAKRYPPKARYFHQQDTVYVRFTIDRGGRLLSSQIVKSQGFAEIDAEVLALLKRAQPLTPPPAEVVGDTITRTVAIQFYLT